MGSPLEIDYDKLAEAMLKKQASNPAATVETVASKQPLTLRETLHLLVSHSRIPSESLASEAHNAIDVFCDDVESSGSSE